MDIAQAADTDQTADTDPSAGGSGPVLDPRVALLCRPFSDADSCGPDLDMDGDSDYLNFFAAVEGVLPTTFFSPEDGSPFDRSTVDIQSQLDAIKPLLQRTRDIRLLILQARLSILNKDLGGFAVNLAATAYWLEKFWNAVHPRPQSGDSARSATISTLDLPTVIFPLQYAPLVEARRHGQISYRTWMIATGEVQPRAGEVQLPQALITETISSADPAALASVRNDISLVKASLDTIRNAFLANRESAGLDKLSTLVTTIRGFIDPQAAAAEAGPEAETDAADLASAGDAGPVPASLAQVRRALAAIADYYTRSEPSSPVLLLVRQARDLIGKSFFEVMNILMPAHVERAAFQIGADRFFELPLEKLSNFADMPQAPAGGGDQSGEDQSAGDQSVGDQPAGGQSVGDRSVETAFGDPGAGYTVTSRAQAIALLDQIHRYFRRSEPSSPVPMLCDRARALAERDFMSVLRDVLPRDALRSVDDGER
ncbi:MAG TPA: type VI secretion system ImpA family N-terminal domain-containing protein [Xanthobacteraceae bacterium]|nr:type VI secretion system ImpA family N-terminal domain-containing protein [Xanthobacteraceae bacterium]